MRELTVLLVVLIVCQTGDVSSLLETAYSLALDRIVIVPLVLLCDLTSLSRRDS